MLYVCLITSHTLTTNVRRHKVLVGERGSSAAAKSQTLILLWQIHKPHTLYCSELAPMHYTNQQTDASVN